MSGTRLTLEERVAILEQREARVLDLVVTLFETLGTEVFGESFRAAIANAL